MTSSYYQIAKEASGKIDNQGLKEIQRLAHKAKNILDLGCGEGTRLNTLLKPSQKGTGIDINKTAISQAKKQFPRHTFKTYQGKTLPFKKDSFDLVYSAYVLEHTQDPEDFVTNTIKVLAPRGHLALIFPNFGAPSRRSPNSIEPPLKKLLTGLKNDLKPLPPTSLHTTKVRPKKIFISIDDDTTVEPYLLTLIRFLKNQGLTIKKHSSLWHLEPFTLNPRKLLFTILGKLSLYPFKYWGPQGFVIAQKK